MPNFERDDNSSDLCGDFPFGPKLPIAAGGIDGAAMTRDQVQQAEGRMSVEQVFQSAVLALTGRFQCLKKAAVVAGIRADLPRSLPADREDAWPLMLALVASGAATYEVEIARTTDTQVFQELRACHDIMLKTARRCARDLRHAVDHVTDKDLLPIFRERIQLYETVFADLTAYHLDLHRQIANLEEERDRMHKDYSDACETIRKLRAQAECDELGPG